MQKQLYSIIDDNVELQIHCSVYRMNSQRGSTCLPRYWITLGKQIVFDYPKVAIDKENYPYITEVSDISDLIRQYMDTPREQLPTKSFDSDKYGITNLLKSADKRISVAKLRQYFSDSPVENAEVCMMILDARK